MPSAPEHIGLSLLHRDDASLVVLVDAYSVALRAAGRGDVVTSAPSPGIVELAAKDGTHVQFLRGLGGRPVWAVDARHRKPKRLDEAWMKAMIDVARAAIAMPGFVEAVLHRGGWADDFVPFPPLAKNNHAITTSDQQVAACYEHPEAFWRAWETVERHGEVRLCVRALDDLDELSWLARTYESTMRLARTARPGLTEYYAASDPGPDYEAWWEFGDLNFDKGGFPALELGWYDAATRTVQFGAYVSKAPLSRGGDAPRAVHIREIHEVRDMVESQEDGEGRSIGTVRIIFNEEWMAREQRRPLLDVGAKVFFVDREGDVVPVED